MGDNRRWYSRVFGNLFATDQVWCQKIIEHRQLEWVHDNLSPLIRDIPLEHMLEIGLYDKAEGEMAYPLQNVMSYSAALASRLYSAHRGVEEKVSLFFSPFLIGRLTRSIDGCR